jgi:hypothetical protein
MRIFAEHGDETTGTVLNLSGSEPGWISGLALLTSGSPLPGSIDRSGSEGAPFRHHLASGKSPRHCTMGRPPTPAWQCYRMGASATCMSAARSKHVRRSRSPASHWSGSPAAKATATLILPSLRIPGQFCLQRG